MKVKIENDSELQCQKQIELAAETLAHILIQQAMSKRNLVGSQQIENKYGKPNK
ncbi:MAG TPA: hypothetical protein VMR77_03715 [Patescibacteria group bacterium]|nr:hypothetical protein [Patescibacteria group bacterium]